MLPHLVQRTEIDFHQHRDDHHPDEQTDWDVDARNLEPPEQLRRLRRQLAKRNPGGDTEQDPQRQPALEESDRWFGLR